MSTTTKVYAVGWAHRDGSQRHGAAGSKEWAQANADHANQTCPTIVHRVVELNESDDIDVMDATEQATHMLSSWPLGDVSEPKV